MEIKTFKVEEITEYDEYSSFIVKDNIGNVYTFSISDIHTNTIKDFQIKASHILMSLYNYDILFKQQGRIITPKELYVRCKYDINGDGCVEIIDIGHVMNEEWVQSILDILSKYICNVVNTLMPAQLKDIDEVNIKETN